MPSTSSPLPLIRVLVALAWADGELSQNELNFLKDFLFKFDLTGEDWARIEMYIDEPVPPSEAEALIRDFTRSIGSRQERNRVLTLLEDLTRVDGVTTPEEKEFLDRFLELLKNSNPAASVVSRLQAIFQTTVLKPVEGSGRSGELYEYLNNRILFKVRRKLERENLSLEAHPEELAYATLFGGLLGYVASVHQPMKDREIQVLRSHLLALDHFDEEAVELITAVTLDATADGIDRFRLTREFYKRSQPQQRLELLDCLFDIAGSDTDLHHSEVEEVRAIAYGLKISHREFIKAKVSYLDQNRSSS